MLSSTTRDATLRLGGLCSSWGPRSEKSDFPDLRCRASSPQVLDQGVRPIQSKNADQTSIIHANRQDPSSDAHESAVLLELISQLARDQPDSFFAALISARLRYPTQRSTCCLCETNR